MTNQRLTLVPAVMLVLIVLNAHTAAAVPANSQAVLQRYARAVDAIAVPKNVIFAYAISQAGPTDIEQKHLMYRSGSAVRDELLVSSSTKAEETTITERIDRYDIARIAPRLSSYGFLFSRKIVSNGEVLYLYDTFPLSATATGGFVVTRIVIDSKSFLPRTIVFHATDGVIVGKGELQYARVGVYWMPVSAKVAVQLDGKLAQERITWSGYRFPASLPALTFTK